MNKFFASILSMITRKPVYTGIGVSTVENMKISDATYQKHKENHGHMGVIKHLSYKSRDPEQIGEFRLINLSRKVPGKVHYQLKHMSTGKVYNLPKDLFELLFERK